MASTRLKNQRGTYSLERNANQHFIFNRTYKDQSLPQQSVLPDLGINGGNMISGYYNQVLSNNACDIESQLMGINSTNLVFDSFKTTPQTNELEHQQFFKLPSLNLPVPLNLQKNQRPMGPYSS